MSKTTSTHAAIVSAAQPADEAERTGGYDLVICPRSELSHNLAVLTLVLWMSFLLLGAIGFVLPYARPHPPTPPEEPVLGQKLEAELTPERPPPPDIQPLPSDPLAPPPLVALASPPIAAAIAIAQASPAIAFPLPVEGPIRIVEVKQAEHAARPATNVAAPPKPAPGLLPLTFGEGEGKQPSPEYPRLAIRQGQEGVVVVRLIVGENGRVSKAEAAQASSWPLLNEAALRVVRERWQFPSGPGRIYEVSIRFELEK